jgi:hypothetical protein
MSGKLGRFWPHFSAMFPDVPAAIAPGHGCNAPACRGAFLLRATATFC